MEDILVQKHSVKPKTIRPGVKEAKIRKLCGNFNCNLLKPQLYATEIKDSMIQTKWKIIRNLIGKQFISRSHFS